VGSRAGVSLAAAVAGARSKFVGRVTWSPNIVIALEATVMKILTSDEILQLAEAAIKGSGGTLCENRVIGAVKWAQQARVQAALLEGILAGKYLVDVSGDEPLFMLADQHEESIRVRMGVNI
jgi:hypothetical protein